ncbi:hypothetical protein [Paucibacter soli]|uniref:hypothetical protein n=1 Tax=Paucibacter soli TaxID=3133433 RepID=UPI0030AC23E9
MTTLSTPIQVALCVRSEDTPFASAVACSLLPIPAGFFDLPTSLRGRKVNECCENDPSWKQLLPYVVALDDSGDIFAYTRGKAGAEGRLHGNISIGLGGHVDLPPEAGQPLESHLVAEANRELDEEACLPPAHLKFEGLICDPTNEVGQVHIGLLSIRQVSASEKEAMMAEAGVVEKGMFVTLDYLLQPDVFERLENWSKCAVLHIAQMRGAAPVSQKDPVAA